MLRTLVDTPESKPEAVEGPCPDTVITAADRPRLPSGTPSTPRCATPSGG